MTNDNWKFKKCKTFKKDQATKVERFNVKRPDW